MLKKAIKFSFMLTGTIWGINNFISINSNNSNKLNKKNYSNYESRFGVIKYKKYGKGKKPILFIHNLSVGDNLNEWNYIYDYFIDDYTIYAINLIGCGNSDKNNVIYTNYMFVRLINDFIHDVIKEKADILASGYSSRIAVMCSYYNKDIIGKIATINAGEPDYVNISQDDNTKMNVLIKKMVNKIINFPVFGTFIYNCIFSKRRCLSGTEGDFNFYQYMLGYYYSVHFDNSKSKYLYTSIVENKTYIDYNKVLSLAKNEIYDYVDFKYNYPHISATRVTAKNLLAFFRK